MKKNYLKKLYQEDWKKVKDLIYSSKINNKVKNIIMSDEEFIWDAITEVQLWKARNKKFSLKKAINEIIEQYIKQIPLITARRLNNEDYK